MRNIVSDSPAPCNYLVLNASRFYHHVPMSQHIGLTGSADSRIDYWFRECKRKLVKLGNPRARMSILVFPSDKQAAYWAEKIALGSFVESEEDHLGGRHQPLHRKHKDDAIKAILPHPSAVAFLAALTMIDELCDYDISYRFVAGRPCVVRSRERTSPDEIPEAMFDYIGYDSMNHSANADLLRMAINVLDPPVAPFEPEVYIFHPDGWKLPADFNPEQEQDA